MSILFSDENYLKSDTDAPNCDRDVYRRERALAQLAEPLGFNSLWSLEHHFTGYVMVPDVLQFLAYMAGQTTHIRLGTMVVVLPWHQPARVVDSVAMLDNLSDGRIVLGIGRGLGRVEFEGLGVSMEESRVRFVESAELLLMGLDQGYIEYDGTLIQQPKRWIRPAPTRSFKGRTYAAAVSPESLEIAARLGVGLLITPQKPWDTIISEVGTYKEKFGTYHGVEAPEPIVVNHVFCDEDVVRATEVGQQLIGDYYSAVMKHYELAGDHFAKTSGYEYYSGAAAQLRKQSDEQARRWYADLQCYGTPSQCIERIAYIKESIGCSEFICFLSFGMSSDEARRNTLLFAQEVMPRLKDFGLRSKDAPSVQVAFPTGF